MTTLIAAHNPVDKDADDRHDDLLLAIAKMNAGARGGDTVLAEPSGHWRFTEEEIVRGVIAVILVALVTVIGLAAAFLIMG